MPTLDTIGRALIGSGAAPGRVSGGIKLYHQSPYDFERFDWGKVGAGEGAQAFGQGFYGSQSPAVSGQGGHYWEQFMRKFSGPELRAARALQDAGFDRAKAIANLDREIGTEFVMPKYNKLSAQMWREGAIDARRLLETGKPVGPRTYEINYGTEPSELLTWD